MQEKAFKDIRAIGAIWFRDGPTSRSSQGIANYVDEVRRAKENRLKVLMPLVQMDENYDGPLPTNQCGWKEKKLSAINLDKFATRVRRLLDALKGADLMIDAVELGSRYPAVRTQRKRAPERRQKEWQGMAAAFHVILS